MFGNIRFDAVFISQKNQPSIDLWNFRMSIESGIGINKNLELRILRRQRGLFLAQYKSANQHHCCNHHQNSFSTLCHMLPSINTLTQVNIFSAWSCLYYFIQSKGWVIAIFRCTSASVGSAGNLFHKSRYRCSPSATPAKSKAGCRAGHPSHA